MNTQKLNQYMIPISILVAGLLIGVGIFLGGYLHNEKNTASDTASSTSQIAITSDGSPFIGSANAPLTVYYWSDYQCPFCKQFESTSLQSLITDYVKTNKVKVVFKDLQFLGQDSTNSSYIARAIWQLYPAQYYTWREGYFQNQDAEGDVGFGNPTTVYAFTQTVPGIDVNKVKAEVAQNTAQYQKEITADYNQAGSNGVNGTPGVMVGNVLAPNPLDYSSLKSLVDSQLSQTN